MKSKIIKKKILKKGFSDKDISIYISKTILATSTTLEKIKPEKVVILGDRYELLGCAIAAMSHRIPIAHIHGGEVTTGAIDDSIRHSVPKLSHLHFPIHEVYKKRLIQLGENPKTIFNFGGLGAYSINKTKFISKKKLEKELCIKFKDKDFLSNISPNDARDKSIEKSNLKFIISTKKI